MANRPVYVVKTSAPYFAVQTVEFAWNGGFAKSQKQKNITALHTGFTRSNPEKKVLEISSKSMQEYGEALSAFFMKKYVPALGKSVPVECVYQAGKVFKNGGPYPDILEKTPKAAKGDERLKSSGALIAYEFDGKRFPITPKNVFYNFIYINALFENPELAEAAMEYDAFTDIEFNPDKSINCQALAAATFVSLSRMGLIDRVRDFESFLGLYAIKPVKAPPAKKENEAPSDPGPAVCPGDTIVHKAYGRGEIVEVTDNTIVAVFPDIGRKNLGRAWCTEHCEIIHRENGGE